MLKSGEDYTVEYKMDGYKTEFRRIRNRIGIKWVVLDVLFGVCPVVIDAVTGAWCEFESKTINAAMERKRDE